MNNLKSVNEFFDFLKSKDSEEDKIALIFIQRLEKIKDTNPYKITEKRDSNSAGTLVRYIINFDDSPILIIRVNWIHNPENRPDVEYSFKINCDDDIDLSKWTKIDCKEKYMEKLFDLVDNVYKNVQYHNKINKIKSNINPSADLLD